MPSTAPSLLHQDQLSADRSAADVAFRELWRAIVSGKLAPGVRVTEEELARMLAISRTPLRETIRRLERIGLLTRQLGRGMRVTELSLQEMEHLSQARERLEGLIAFLVTQRYAGGEIDLEQLQRLHERMKKLVPLGDMNLVLDTGLAFHQEMRRLSGSAHAERMLAELLLALERYRYLVGELPQRAAGIVAEHEEVIRLIRSKDADAAERAMRAHVGAARTLYRERFQALRLP
jgi:DNA-binding GntR family transcriptional regulator